MAETCEAQRHCYRLGNALPTEPEVTDPVAQIALETENRLLMLEWGVSHLTPRIEAIEMQLDAIIGFLRRHFPNDWTETAMPPAALREPSYVPLAPPDPVRDRAL